MKPTATASGHGANLTRLRPTRQGLALIEVLVAMAVLAIGLGGTLRLQTWLRVSTDLARQRAEALRLAQDSHEALRAYASLADWTAIASSGPSPVALAHANTAYQITRSTTTLADPRLKHVSTVLSWPDRDGQSQQLQLDTLLAGQDPMWSAALTLNRGAVAAAAGAAPGLRHVLIPPQSKSLGDGRSVFKPRPQDTLAWVFDDQTGNVVARCDATAGLSSAQLDANSLGTCRAIAGLLISGHVRFALDTDSPRAVEAENPLSPALPLDLRLLLTSSGHPNPGWECADDAPDAVAPAQLSVAYHCVIQGAGLPPRWSGQLDIVPLGWTLASSGVTGYRVCRYSADHNHNGRIDNAEHPASYTAVGEPLGNQNFLILRAAAGCPQDSGVSSLDGIGGNWLDDSTLAHQP
jgi:prepilin-type N-terminal cleavage/methylation domain-containing protein